MKSNTKYLGTRYEDLFIKVPRNRNYYLFLHQTKIMFCGREKYHKNLMSLRLTCKGSKVPKESYTYTKIDGAMTVQSKVPT